MAKIIDVNEGQREVFPIHAINGKRDFCVSVVNAPQDGLLIRCEPGETSVFLTDAVLRRHGFARFQRTVTQTTPVDMGLAPHEIEATTTRPEFPLSDTKPG
jgi:hypothetical protein